MLQHCVHSGVGHYEKYSEIVAVHHFVTNYGMFFVSVVSQQFVHCFLNASIRWNDKNYIATSECYEDSGKVFCNLAFFLEDF